MQVSWFVFVLVVSSAVGKDYVENLYSDKQQLYNADVDLKTPQLIRKYGYPSESHTIQTADGYLLTMHRIPHGRKLAYNASKIPVFIQHGLMASSSTWIISGLNRSLPYILADLGYDVWLGNARGNTYSRSHVSLPTDDPKFWDFSFHEMGIYDLPASIDWVLNVTGHKKLFYIGHSMGTTIFYVMASMRPEYNDKVQLMVSLAPVAFVGNIKSPIRLLVPFIKDLEFISRYLGQGEFLPHNKIIQWLSKFGCELVTIEKKICEDTIFVIAGFDEAQFNMTLLPVVLGHAPAGSSTKTIIHYAQEVKSGKFQQYDNDCESTNCIGEPSSYNLTKITVPMEIHYAENDWLASLTDVNHLLRLLKTEVGLNKVDFPQFNHIDFVWAKDVYRLVFAKVLQNLKKYENAS